MKKKFPKRTQSQFLTWFTTIEISPQWGPAVVIRWVDSDVAANDGIRQLMAHNCELVSVTIENLKNRE